MLHAGPFRTFGWTVKPWLATASPITRTIVAKTRTIVELVCAELGDFFDSDLDGLF